MEGYAPWERRHRAHFDFMVHNLKSLVQVFCASVVSFFVLTVLVRMLLRKSQRRQPWQNWIFCLHMIKSITSICLPIMSAYAIAGCDPPAAYTQVTGTFLQNTFLTNKFCVDNANFTEALCVTVYLAHLWVELFFYHFVIGEHFSGLTEVYLHHGICITRATTALLVGRMCLTLTNAVLMAELTQVYVSMR